MDAWYNALQCAGDKWSAFATRPAIKALNHQVHPSLFIQMIRLAAIWFALATCAVASPPEEQSKPSSGEKPKPKITISKETTYITEPLRPDGYPDYVAALNQRASKGVTPENNAAVLLLKALGPGIVSEKSRKDTFRLLDIDDLPSEGEYIVDQKEAIKRWRAKQQDGAKLPSDEELEEQFDRAEEQPWSEDEFPVVAFWLSLNATPLEVAIGGIERPKYFFPYVATSEDYPPAPSVLVPMGQESRQIAYLLATRAMLRLRLGDTEAAWRDLKACHLLARHVASSLFMVELLVSDAIEGIAIQADVELAHQGNLSAMQAKRMQAEVEALPPLPGIEKAFDSGERFMGLDEVAYVARKGDFHAAQKIIDLITGNNNSAESPHSKLTPGEAFFMNVMMDWNAPMRMVNRWYDRMVAAARIADARSRRKAINQFDHDVKEFIENIKNPWLIVAGALTKSPWQNLTDVVGSAFVIFLSSETLAEEAQDRLALLKLMDQTAFALAAYRADHGHYPGKLDELLPKYVSEIPDDIFAEKPTQIRYRREGDVYMLWSVYRNGVDDNGRGNLDNPPGDDWVLRPVPAKKDKGR
jgi:hypothetical protein